MCGREVNTNSTVRIHVLVNSSVRPWLEIQGMSKFHVASGDIYVRDGFKPAARFKAVQTYLKPSRRFKSRPGRLRAVQTASKLSVRTNVVTKPSSKRAAKPSCP